jgi:predicted transcriptional regulator
LPETDNDSTSACLIYGIGGFFTGGKDMSERLTGGRTPVINLRKTGENIARMRREAGISVREMQIMFGFTNPQAIYSWQNGRSLPSVDNFIILAAILGTTIDEIISVEEDDPENNEDISLFHSQLLS